MISHSDRAQAALQQMDQIWTDAEPTTHRGLIPKIQAKALAAEFDRLLPEGSVAVDRELLRVVLEVATARGGWHCVWPNCPGRDWSGMEHPHSPRCPLGGDDASE